MPSSSVLISKRCLVSLLLRAALAYQVVVSVNRTSPDTGVKAAFRQVALTVHPDRRSLCSVAEWGRWAGGARGKAKFGQAGVHRGRRVGGGEGAGAGGGGRCRGRGIEIPQPRYNSFGMDRRPHFFLDPPSPIES